MKDILKILNAGLDAVSGEKAIHENLRVSGNILNIYGKSFDLKNFKNIYVLGAGKVSSLMASAVEKILEDKITEGLVVTKEKQRILKKIEEVQGSHPIPDKKSLSAGMKILKLAREANENDLVIFLLSGGASSLAVVPKGISLKEKQIITKLLLECAADIKEINTIRKHLSQLKGGNLAKAIYPATCITLIISDVLGNDLSFIGSGPTAPDETIFRDCLEIMDKYNLKNEAPRIYRYFERSVNFKNEETLKSDNPIFTKTFNFIIAYLDKALQSAAIEAKHLGYQTEIIKEKNTGIASKEGEKLAKKVKELKNKTCLIAGGETTVIVTGKGHGGRNLELALGFLNKISKDPPLANIKGVEFLSVGTDGDDGTSGVAGAVVGEQELKKSQELKLDFEEYLRDNNSLAFFQKTNGILKFPQNTNVGDIQILIKE